MIAKAKTVKNGFALINYIFGESKNAELVASNLIGSIEPDEIYQEMQLVAKRNTRCEKPWLSIKMGIALQDEAKFKQKPELFSEVCEEFSKRLGFDNHQWFACTHGDTDNLHMHLVANRISLNSNKAYVARFISNRCANTADKISQDMNFVIANDIRKQREYQDCEFSRSDRYEARRKARGKVEAIMMRVLSGNSQNLEEFIQAMEERGVDVVKREHKHKKVVYGLSFGMDGENFKASSFHSHLHNRVKAIIRNDVDEAKRNQYSREINETKEGFNRVDTHTPNFMEEVGSLLITDEQDESKKKRKKRRRF